MLLKNHDLRSVGTITNLGANASLSKNSNRFRGHEQKSRRGSHKGGSRPTQNNNINKPWHKNALVSIITKARSL